MTSRRLWPIAFALLLVACSDDDGGPSCGVLTGTYVETDARDSSNPGNCPPSTNNDTTAITVVDRQDGTAELVFGQLSGSCPGVVNGCEFTTKCVFTDASGAVVGSVQLSLDFTGDGYSGYLAGSLPDGKGGQCTANYNVTAVKK